MVPRFQPDVLLLGPKRLQRNTIERLQEIRASNSKLGIVLLLAFYEAEDVKLLRNMVLRGKGSIAILLKQSLDRMEQLHRAVLAVSQGQVILDPALPTPQCAERPAHQFLRELTARQSTILNLLSKGYTNFAIAEALGIDVKTVEHHLNTVYAKLRDEAEFNGKHPRVSAARLYLEATSEL